MNDSIPPISVNWDELSTRKVDNRLRELKALERTRSHSRLADTLTADTPKTVSTPKKRSYYLSGNSIVPMTLLGLTGGLLAWSALFFISRLANTTQKEEARSGLIAWVAADQKVLDGQIQSRDADGMKAEIRNEFSRNPYFDIAVDPGLSASQKKSRVARLDLALSERVQWLTVIGFSVCGMLLCAFHAAAIPLKDRNDRGALQAAIISALPGLGVGALFGFFGDSVFNRLLMGAAADPDNHLLVYLCARATTWTVFGALLGVASGVPSRHLRRILIGGVGGAFGGALAGIFFELMSQSGASEIGCDLSALITIGVMSLNATAMIENAAKTCWLKALSGPMERKQFILYRNPSFIGSAPDCHVFLPREANVGKRHAALYLVEGGIEIENLPLGGDTLVNGKVVSRRRLRNGDEIQIGATRFAYQEKVGTSSFYMAYMNLLEHAPVKKASPAFYPPVQVDFKMEVDSRISFDSSQPKIDPRITLLPSTPTMAYLPMPTPAQARVGNR